jgi:hypothetical protein
MMEFLPEELEANVERYADFFEGHKISHTAGNAMDDAKQTIATMLGVAVIALGVALLVNGGPATTANASHEPAEKAAVSGSSLEIMESTTANGSFSEVHTLLTTEMRTSNPTDLILQFTNECALWTDVTTVGNDQSESHATVKAWVEVDGERVPVSDDEDAKFVLCNSEYRVETMNVENENGRPNATCAPAPRTRPTGLTSTWAAARTPSRSRLNSKVKPRASARATPKPRPASASACSSSSPSSYRTTRSCKPSPPKAPG